MRNIRLFLLTGFALLVLLAPGCGGGGSSGGGQPAGSIKVTMSDFKFSPSSLSASAGKVTFYLVNAGAASHDMTITAPDGKQFKSELVQPGSAAIFTVDTLAAGSYKVFCSQPGHADSGMTATLQVS